MMPWKVSARIGPTPGAVIKRTATGSVAARVAAAWSAVASVVVS